VVLCNESLCENGGYKPVACVTVIKKSVEAVIRSTGTQLSEKAMEITMKSVGKKWCK
jgi:hypothetical protein